MPPVLTAKRGKCRTNTTHYIIKRYLEQDEQDIAIKLREARKHISRSISKSAIL